MNRRTSGTRTRRPAAPSSATRADLHAVPERVSAGPRVLAWHSSARPEAESALKNPPTRTATRGALALLEEPVVQLLAPPPMTGARPCTTQSRILVALDDALQANAVLDALEAESDPTWIVDIASSGMQALAFVAASPPRLALLDIALAERDGAAVYHQLRADPTTERIPIIFTAAATSLDLYERGIQEGLLLRRPFDLGDLVPLVRELLRQ